MQNGMPSIHTTWLQTHPPGNRSARQGADAEPSCGVTQSPAAAGHHRLRGLPGTPRDVSSLLDLGHHCPWGFKRSSWALSPSTTGPHTAATREQQPHNTLREGLSLPPRQLVSVSPLLWAV